MELRVIRYFLAVAREETITGAADFLRVSQPTLSRQLMDLETELGRTLFIRGNRRITLTYEGILFRQRAQEIIDLVDKTEAEFLAPDEMISGDIRIGSGETHALSRLTKVVKDLQHDFPSVKYHMFSGSAEEVTDRLDKGLIDFGILIEPADVTKYGSIRLPDTDVWGILMRRDSPLADHNTIVPEDLLDLPLICSRQAMNGKTLSDWLKRDYAKLNIVATYNLLYNASLMVAEGLGYALCLDKIVNTSGSSALSFKPLSPGVEARMDIVWKEHQVFSKAARIFIDRLRKAVHIQETRFAETT